MVAYQTLYHQPPYILSDASTCFTFYFKHQYQTIDNKLRLNHNIALDTWHWDNEWNQKNDKYAGGKSIEEILFYAVKLQRITMNCWELLELP